MYNYSKELLGTTPKPPEVDDDWMKKLSGDVSLAALSIPGTHDSLSTPYWPMYRCQAWSLEDQLNVGIRYLDIHCQIEGGVLHCNSKGKSLESVFNTIVGFLEQHDKATVLVNIREALSDDSLLASFQKMFRNCITLCGQDKFYTCSSIPTMDEAKGKIVIIGRLEAIGKGIEWYLLRSADRQYVRTLLSVSIGGKLEDIKEHLEQARSLTCDYDLYVTYCSGNSKGAYPVHVADRINSKVYDHISKYQGKQRFGVVVMDLSLINQIIGNN